MAGTTVITVVAIILDLTQEFIMDGIPATVAGPTMACMLAGTMARIIVGCTVVTVDTAMVPVTAMVDMATVLVTAMVDMATVLVTAMVDMATVPATAITIITSSDRLKLS